MGSVDAIAQNQAAAQIKKNGTEFQLRRTENKRLGGQTQETMPLGYPATVYGLVLPPGGSSKAFQSGELLVGTTIRPSDIVVLMPAKGLPNDPAAGDVLRMLGQGATGEFRDYTILEVVPQWGQSAAWGWECLGRPGGLDA
jgi:hypothetical protein